MISSNHINRTIKTIALLAYAPLCFALEQKQSEIEKEKQKTISPTTKVPQSNTEALGQATTSLTVGKIIISGNNMVPDSVILSRLPFKPGEQFNPNKTKTLLHNLYYDLKRFRTIEVKGEHVKSNLVDIYINVTEKTPLKKVEFHGNNKLKEKEIQKKIDFSNLPALDAEELIVFAQKIKNLYREKNYHNAQVSSKLELDPVSKKGIAIFIVKEGKRSMVKRVRFVGNKNINSKTLRSKLFTREDWPLSFLDGSGSYQPERIEADKHMIEQYYQSNGYMMAKVVNVDIKLDGDNKNNKAKHFEITFEIKEGDLFTIKEVSTSGHDILKDDYLASRLPIQPGDLYSREKIVNSMKALEGLWGELGYVYVHVDPAIQPDEKNKTVNISFHSELGNKVFLNKINIIGNKKTKDKVIRRKLILSEGQLLTNRMMDMSKNNVDGLGFFDQRDGVTWRKTRVDDEHADLDLILKEIKTGKAHIKLGFGGSPSNMSSSSTGFSVGVEVADRNLFGTGIQLMLNGSWAKGEQSIVFNVTDPWLFDLPITGAFDLYHRRPSYDDFRHIKTVNERLTGAGGTLGFISPYLWNTQVMFRLGMDQVKYEAPPVARVYGTKEKCDQVRATQEYQSVLDKLFDSGKFLWFDVHFGMDRRNHPMHPSRGYKWLAVSHTGIPTFGCNIGFSKFDVDASWYTPLIGERDLVLKLHGYLGFLHKFSERTVPYRELFHIGGPTSIRGFLFGQVGPQFLGDSIGGTKAFFVNAELAFPITPDFNMKGVVFYDGGSGWDNPYASEISPEFLLHNNFKFRHSVGVGLRILNPVPIKIDWGFKLDHNKKLSETTSEVHFAMSYDF